MNNCMYCDESAPTSGLICPTCKLTMSYSVDFLNTATGRAWMQAQINQAAIDNEELDFTPL